MEVFDIVFVGSGVAAGVTFVEIYNILSGRNDHHAKLKIGVIEKTNEFWKGIPYGYRSSVNSLTITSVFDFIHENERKDFFEWVIANKALWTDIILENGGITGKRWLNNNLPLVDKEAWHEVYMPRFIFGMYMQQKVTKMVQDLQSRDLAEVIFIHAEVIHAKADEQGHYEIELENPDRTKSSVKARKLVVTAGSAPVRKICAESSFGLSYINDIYFPSVKENLTKLNKLLNEMPRSENRNLLVVGSNASSIELLYLLEGIPELMSLVNKIVIMSTSGILPYHISTEVLNEHPLPNLEQLKREGNYTIQSLSFAAGEDIKLALQNGANMEYIATIIKNTLEMMEVLGEQAKKEFYCIYGLKLRDSFRRSGPEYKGATKILTDNNQVILVKGKYKSSSVTANGVEVYYLDTENEQLQNYPACFSAIINCTGSDNLDQSDSRFIYNIINDKLCKMNLSGKGIEVNDKFEAAPNLYIMGPLLGGNVNKLIHFWQLENVARLTYLAPYLAKELV